MRGPGSLRTKPPHSEVNRLREAVELRRGQYIEYSNQGSIDVMMV